MKHFTVRLNANGQWDVIDLNTGEIVDMFEDDTEAWEVAELYDDLAEQNPDIELEIEA